MKRVRKTTPLQAVLSDIRVYFKAKKLFKVSFMNEKYLLIYYVTTLLPVLFMFHVV